MAEKLSDAECERIRDERAEALQAYMDSIAHLPLAERLALTSQWNQEHPLPAGVTFRTPPNRSPKLRRLT